MTPMISRCRMSSLKVGVCGGSSEGPGAGVGSTAAPAGDAASSRAVTSRAALDIARRNTTVNGLREIGYRSTLP